jgi:RNA polymerase sigma-70 factor (ECF subfamily)
MRRYAQSIVGQDADDVVQQAWVDAIRGGKTFSGQSGVRSWLLTLTRHAAFRSKRLRSGQPRIHVPLDTIAVAAGWGSDPEISVASRLDAARLGQALATLHPEAREVLTLRDLEGLAGPEVALMLHVTLPAMKSRLHRARVELAAAVRKEFGHGA